MTEEQFLSEVPFIIEQNENGTYAIIENPDSEVYGNHPYLGEKVVRSPFSSEAEALERLEAINEHWEYKSVRVNN